MTNRFENQGTSSGTIHDLRGIGNSRTRTRRRLSTGQILKLAAVASIEVFLGALIYSLLIESFEIAGVEINRFFVDDVLIGWLFQATPDLTAKELLAFVCAVFFIALPVYVWISILDDRWSGELTFGTKTVRAFLLVAYGFVIAGDLVLIFQRINYGANSVFSSPADSQPMVSFFFGLLFVVVNSVAAFMTAKIYLSIQPNQEA